MAEEIQPAKELTPEERYNKAVQAYFAAIQSGDRKLAAKIHSDNNLPYSVGTHS
jgi:hypothetical protein